MKYLFDTQVLIWWFESNKLITEEYKRIIEGKGVKLVSVASIWEIVIKSKAKKLKLGKPLRFLLQNLGFEILGVELNHVLELEKLPSFHKDPFDRILVAQARVEGCVLLTSDRKIKKYFAN